MKSYSLAILLIGISLLSCKKSGSNQDDPNKDPDKGCRVTGYRCESRNETWRIVYNSSGTLDSILIGDAMKVDMIRKFEHSPNQTTVKRFFQGSPGEGSIVEWSGAKVSSIRDLDTGGGWKQMTFIYASDSRAYIERSVLTMFGSTSTFNSQYFWDVNPSPIAINLKKYSTNSGVFTYEYYLDKPTQVGDYLNFEKIIATYDRYYMPFTSTNLLKAIKLDDAPLVDVDYTFDNNGRITSFAVRYDGDPTPEIWKLTYSCK